MSVSIHPLVDGGIAKAAPGFAGGTLRCRCSTDAVEVKVDAQVAFNHACGCTRCWKPEGALFSVIGVVPSAKLSVTANASKLKLVDEKAPLQRHACTGCGVHLYGRIQSKDHAFFGLDFIHTELSKDAGWEGPGFGAFVSSLIEAGTPPTKMAAVRLALKEKGLEAYDCLSPALMDVLATKAAELKGTLRKE